MLDFRWSQNPKILWLIKGLLTPTGIDVTTFSNSAYQVTGLQVHTTTPEFYQEISDTMAKVRFGKEGLLQEQIGAS